MKCPKCGTEAYDQELWKELMINRIVLIIASIAIAFTLIVGTILILGASKPEPQLVGDLIIDYHHDYGGEDDSYTIQVHGYIYNAGPVGCFVVAIIELSDDRGWTSEIPVNLSWMPVNAVEYIFEDIQCPASYGGEAFDYETVSIELEFAFYDPMENNEFDF